MTIPQLQTGDKANTVQPSSLFGTDIFPQGDAEFENLPPVPTAYRPSYNTSVPLAHGQEIQSVEQRQMLRRKICAIICFCFGVCALATGIAFGILGATTAIFQEEQDGPDKPSLTIPTSPVTEPTIASPSTSLVLPEPTGPPVEVTVVNMTVLSYIGGKDAGTLLIQHNKLWWEELDQSEHAVKTIVNCHELGVNTREPSNLCEAGIDLGSQPTLVSADVSEEWAFMLDIQEFPTDENQYLSRLHVHGGDGRIAVLKLTFSSGGMSYCPSQQSLETTSTPSSNLETFEVPVTALIDGNSDQLLVFSNNWIRWFHVKGGKPLAAIINCRVWEPYWGGTKGLWCQECTHPSGETDLCEMNVDTWTNSTLQEVRLVKPVGRDFSFSWKQAPYGVANDEWTIRGGPSNGEWSLRLVNNGYSLVWCSLLLTFNKVGESSCESRPAQSCVELFDTNLVCHQSAQHCAFLAGDAAWPGENCNSYCEVRGEICQEAYSTHYSSCETNIASSCDLLADDNVCKCTRPAA